MVVLSESFEIGKKTEYILPSASLSYSFFPLFLSVAEVGWGTVSSCFREASLDVNLVSRGLKAVRKVFSRIAFGALLLSFLSSFFFFY